MRPSSILLLLPLATGYFGHTAVRGQRSASTVQMGVPAALADASWLPELQATCAVSELAGGAELGSEQRMGAVLEWLQTMLVELELGSTDSLDGAGSEEADELDDDFVATARPWLHTKAFFDIAFDTKKGFTQELWENVSGADYLRDGSGGALLLLLPSRLPLTLFDRVTESLRAGVASDIGDSVSVTGFHPDAEKAHLRSPVPVVQVFADSPDLLVDGGSMGDAAAFL